MNRKEIKELLNQKYERTNFKQLTQSIFSKCDYFNSPKLIETNNDKVLEFLQLGNINLLDGKNLAIFELKLRKDTNIYRNKIELRNLTTKYIDQATNHGVFVIYDNQSEDYRLTFATKYTEINEEGKIIKKETEAKRFSYLLGKNESCRTPSERLEILFNNKQNQSLNDIIDAFNVDKITEQFFNEYKENYLLLLDELENLRKKDKSIESTLSKNNITNEELAKKILSQIVFIFFLQKKGWLGIKRLPDGNFDKWGNGPKNFFKKLYSGEYKKYDNFFNDILEPLFYTALSTDLPENYFPLLKCKIPFLNGGLFDPIKNYNWTETNINIDNKILFDILESFERYNFTINEEDPEDIEIAIDPEMLGKVFEKLLDIKDKKSKGTFYTPRKVVNFICLHSITNYLYDNLDVSIFAKEELQLFVENKHKTNNKLKNKINNYSKNLDSLLSNIKVCDPAIGSGAFAIEILNLIVRCRKSLNEHIKNNKKTNYYLKKYTIQNCIYGVDIETHAIEIAKIRLWLSLIIDENNYEKINPLPNLEYKFINGDSLENITQVDIFNVEKIQKFEQLKKEFFLETNHNKIKIIKEKIQENLLELLKTDSTFDYKIYFSEVFDHRNGFDIVIGNPPYINWANLKAEQRLKYSHFSIIRNKVDLYALFLEQAQKITNKNGQIAFIISNTWKTTDSFFLLRKKIIDDLQIEKIVNLDSHTFKATVTPMIIMLKNKKNRNYQFNVLDNKFEEYQNINISEILSDTYFSINSTSSPQEKIICKKISSISKRLDYFLKFSRGIKTSNDKKFITNQSKGKDYKKIYRGKNIYPYKIKWSGEYIFYKPELMKKKIGSVPYTKEFFEVPEKLVSQRISNNLPIAYDDKGNYFLDTTIVSSFKSIKTNISLIFLCGLLNSKLIKFWYFTKFQLPTVGIYEIHSLPIIYPKNIDQINEIENHVKKIIKKIKNGIDNYSQELNMIDNLVYKIYLLKENEIKIIENFKN